MKQKKMFLCLYRHGNKHTFLLTPNVRESFKTLNERVESVKWTAKDKFASYPFNSWEDFRNIKEKLQPYGLRMYVAECKAVDKTYWKLIIELMNNPLYQMVLSEREEKNEIDTTDEMANVRIIELWDKSDWDYMEKEFGIKSDFCVKLFDVIN
ncbi:MAG: hypothetical protein J6S67_11150 [Methanobrevibacter sp.]|nr:hypothetical protein [Methanobrevibacter sp.]